MQLPIVLVDLDDVLADFDRGTTLALHARNPTIVIPARHNYHIHHNFGSTIDQLIIKEIHNSSGFFRNLPLMSGAKAGWKKLIALGYHPRICSAPLSTNPWCSSEKREWVREHFGDDVANDMILDSHKGAHDGIALIDDRPDIFGAEDAPWQHILFDQPYNRTITTPYRLHGWNDPTLEQMLRECEKQYKA